MTEVESDPATALVVGAKSILKKRSQRCLPISRGETGRAIKRVRFALDCPQDVDASPPSTASSSNEDLRDAGAVESMDPLSAANNSESPAAAVSDASDLDGERDSDSTVSLLSVLGGEEEELGGFDIFAESEDEGELLPRQVRRSQVLLGPHRLPLVCAPRQVSDESASASTSSSGGSEDSDWLFGSSVIQDAEKAITDCSQKSLSAQKGPLTRKRKMRG